jgi:hypothetical protein
MSETEAAPPSRRRSTQRQRHRRQVRKRIFTGIAIAIAVVLVALWFSDTIRFPTDRPSFANGAEPLKSNRASHDPSAPVGATKRALSPADPLRLWIGGDSLAGALGPALGEMTAGTGVVQPTYDSRQGTGLISGDIDWMKHANESMVQANPEAVVFMIGTNDAVVYTDKDAARYEQLVEAMMRELKGNDGREVLWVNAPVMRDEDLEANIKKVDEIQRRVAARLGGITIVDAHTLFADETGEYSSSLPDENGDLVNMRAGDGIHLSGDGAQHLANAVFQQLDAVWNITAQQVAGQTKKVIVAEGSDTNYGMNNGSGSGSGSDSGSGSSRRSWSSNGSGNDETSSGTTPTTSAPTATAPSTSPPTIPPSTTPPTTAASTPSST